jgi:hypothetical protein
MVSVGKLDSMDGTLSLTMAWSGTQFVTVGASGDIYTSIDGQLGYTGTLNNQ